MNPEEAIRHRALCLELAMKHCLHFNESYAVTTRAEEYWTWLNKNDLPAKLALAPKTDDDIPF